MLEDIGDMIAAKRLVDELETENANMGEILEGWKAVALRLEKEIERLKRGDFTTEEMQNLCHNLDQRRPGCTREEFEVGCREYQERLFGSRRDDLTANDSESFDWSQMKIRPISESPLCIRSIPATLDTSLPGCPILAVETDEVARFLEEGSPNDRG